jgi:hypothetical protein
MGGLVVGASGSAYVLIQFLPSRNPTPPNNIPIPSLTSPPQDTPSSPSSNPTTIPPQDLQTVSVLVRDSKSDLPLSDVEVEIVVKEEIVKEKTSDLGSLKVQIPKQRLGEVSISLRKSGYKPINRRLLNLSVEPDKMRTLYLEPENSEIQGNSPGTYAPKANISIKKAIFTEGEPIEVEYSGLPGKYKDSITLIDSSKSEKDRDGFETRYNVGTKGVITFDGVPPGNYEVRAYYNYREGNYYTLIGRQPLAVK